MEDRPEDPAPTSAPADDAPERSGPRGPARLASAVGARARPILDEVVEEVGDVARGARDLASRTVHRRPDPHSSKVRLPCLYVDHPEARNAPVRERGLRTVPIEEIAGTTVESFPRARDFLPMGEGRTSGWQARWQRIESAVDRLVALPPVELYRYDGKYWVSDGHNRIAAALRVGQRDVDAVVYDLLGPGPAEPATPIADYLGGSADLRNAASGRSAHRHAHDDADEEAGDDRPDREPDA